MHIKLSLIFKFHMHSRDKIENKAAVSSPITHLIFRRNNTEYMLNNIGVI